MTEDNELIPEGELSVQWYPGIASERFGAWHVVADGWRHVSSHLTEAEANARLTAYRNHQVEL